jgi:hypothetical protein
VLHSRKVTGCNQVAPPRSDVNLDAQTLDSAKSFIYRTYKISARNSFNCRTYKNKGLITPLFAAHPKNTGVYPLHTRMELPL